MGDIKNLTTKEGIKKMQELATAANICLFTTNLGKRPLATRPMSTQKVDDEGNFWFLSRQESDKNHDLEEDPEVQLFYSNHGSSEYLSVFGYAEVLKDKAMIEELWTPIAKAWFNEGKDDPALTVLKVNVADAYYWDTKNNKMIQLIKIAAGAITGKPLDDGIEGKISI